MYPGHWASVKPDTIAVYDTDTDQAMTWRELDDRSNRVAQLLFARGLRPGDHLSLMMENQLEYFAIGWAAFRSGLYITCINRYLTADEAAYIVNDSGASALIASAALATTRELGERASGCATRLLAGEDVTISSDWAGWEDYAAAVSEMPAEPLADEPVGDSMLYSSGSTGRPKGIKRALSGRHVREGIPGVERVNAYAIDEDTRYLSPAPLYHAAPFGFCMRTLCLGGSVYMMRRFDPESSLANIERHRITHSQWVPTMFIRMLKLDAHTRARYDLTSHTCAIHAAAPCPVEIKHQMMDWWGPILWEYYAGTERNGATIISPEEWLAHPGSVGQARSGSLHICDEDGAELPARESGLIYFEQPERTFEYHNAPEKTEDATHPTHANWTSLGDVGYVDDDGYLYLTDRKAFMIISGGVNIYPREIEDVLILHDNVQDVAVFGIPNPDFGEEVKAVVELMPGLEGGEALGEELLAFCREHLAAYKVPRSIDYIEEMPRLPTGKLYKTGLRDAYWPAKA